MDEVARAAGVGKGTLYRRFADRSSLCLALLDDSERALQDRMLQNFGLSRAAPPAEQLMALLDERGFGDPLVDALALLALIERLPYSVYTLRFTKRAEAIDAMVSILRRGFMGCDVAT